MARGLNSAGSKKAVGEGWKVGKAGFVGGATWQPPQAVYKGIRRKIFSLTSLVSLPFPSPFTLCAIRCVFIQNPTN